MRPPLRIATALAAGLLLAMTALPGRLMAQEAAADLSGNWKLVVFTPVQEIALGLVEVSKAGDGYAGKILASAFPVNAMSFEKIEAKGDQISLLIKGGPINDPFLGTLAKGKALGTVKIQGSDYPALLEKTTEKEIAQPDRNAAQALITKLNGVMTEKDPKAKLGKIQALLDEKPQIGTANILYPEAIKSAVASGSDANAVKALVDRYVATNQGYGSALANSARLKAATALGDKPANAPVALELARTAEKALDASSTTDQKVAVYSVIATSAKAAGDAKAADEAHATLEKLNAQLDAEYHEKVPPFKPETYAGRKNKDGNRIALMELFTGAECPPCVAADVAFDALAKTYNTTDVVLLQYHLHIPGPDPLTNKETQDRSKYYPELRGTPSTFFDGKSAAGGGGGMANSQSKYDEYRSILDEAIDQAPKAEIVLKADLKDGAIKIVANAKSDAKAKDAKLRLVVVEDTVRYPGGNGLRFHHKVVRGMPGGVDGIALANGQAKVDMTVKLADLKATLESGIAEFQKSREFTHPLPPIDLKSLSIVAFVQDDSDKAVLQTAIVPLDGGAAH